MSLSLYQIGTRRFRVFDSSLDLALFREFSRESRHGPRSWRWKTWRSRSRTWNWAAFVSRNGPPSPLEADGKSIEAREMNFTNSPANSALRLALMSQFLDRLITAMKSSAHAATRREMDSGRTKISSPYGRQGTRRRRSSVCLLGYPRRYPFQVVGTEPEH